MKTIREMAEEMLKKCEFVTLASVNKEGYPRPVPMGKLKSDGLTIWMATSLDSFKAKDFSTNKKAGVCFKDNNQNGVALTGDIEIFTDEKIKKELWQDMFVKYFKGGVTDPNYIVLKFNPKFATYWIEDKFVHEKVDK